MWNLSLFFDLWSSTLFFWLQKQRPSSWNPLQVDGLQGQWHEHCSLPNLCRGEMFLLIKRVQKLSVQSQCALTRLVPCTKSIHDNISVQKKGSEHLVSQHSLGLSFPFCKERKVRGHLCFVFHCFPEFPHLKSQIDTSVSNCAILNVLFNNLIKLET